MDLHDTLHQLAILSAHNDARLKAQAETIDRQERRIAGMERRQAEIIDKQARRILELEEAVYLMSLELANRSVHGGEIFLN